MRCCGLHVILGALTGKHLIACRGLMLRGSSSIVTSVGNAANLAQSNAAASAALAPTALLSVRRSTGMLRLLLQAQVMLQVVSSIKL